MKYNARPVLHKVARINQEIALESKKKSLRVFPNEISCKPGCSSCCSRPVNLTLAEASNIRDFLIKVKKWKEVESRSLALRKMEIVDQLTWFQMKLECPVLDPLTKRCLAYDLRPIACSTHYVISPPSSCDPWSTEPIQYDRAYFGDIEERAAKELNRVIGKSIWSVSLIMHSALLMVESIVERSGYNIDQVLISIAREQ